MKLTLHIIAKDLRRLAPLLAVWSVLFAWRIYLCSRLVQVAGWEPNHFMQQGMGIAGVTALIGVFNYIIASALLLEDPVTGSRMFWVTRPISGTRMLVAKVLGKHSS